MDRQAGSIALRTAELEMVWHHSDPMASTWQVGHSNDRYAYGCIPVPVVAMGPAGGRGILVVAGNHGDEFEGQVIARRAISALRRETLRGRVVILATANLPAARAQRRTSPIDGGNLNRSFPGSAADGPTSIVARGITDGLLPGCDGVVDLHSGGRATRYVPSAFLRITRADGPEQTAAKLSAARAVGLPWTLIVDETADARSLSAECDRAGVVSIATELGGGAAVDPGLVHVGLEGLFRLLRHWGVLAPVDQAAPPATRFVRLMRDAEVMSTQHGLWEPTVEVGTAVSAGDEVGQIHSLEQPAGEAVSVRAEQDGLIAIRRLPPVVSPGDYLCSLASDYEAETEKGAGCDGA